MDIEEDQVPLVVMGSEWTQDVAMDQPLMLSFIHSVSQPASHLLIHSNSVTI